jgi:hypothetical protein
MAILIHPNPEKEIKKHIVTWRLNSINFSAWGCRSITRWQKHVTLAMATPTTIEILLSTALGGQSATSWHKEKCQVCHCSPSLNVVLWYNNNKMDTGTLINLIFSNSFLLLRGLLCGWPLYTVMELGKCVAHLINQKTLRTRKPYSQSIIDNKA